MENLTKIFNTLYYPETALIVFKSKEGPEAYIEKYDFDENHRPINPALLSTNDAFELADILCKSGDHQNSIAQTKEIYPENILYHSTTAGNYIYWYTPAQYNSLYFIESLGIPNGMAGVPPLIWKANKHSLYIYAFKDRNRPSITTKLYTAPFFNIYYDAQVCMGTVELDFSSTHNIKQFTKRWEEYFWNSKFSHAMAGAISAKSNIIQLWQDLIKNRKPFPLKQLRETNTILKDIL